MIFLDRSEGWVLIGVRVGALFDRRAGFGSVGWVWDRREGWVCWLCFFFFLMCFVPEVEGERQKGREREREREIVKKNKKEYLNKLGKKNRILGC